MGFLRCSRGVFTGFAQGLHGIQRGARCVSLVLIAQSRPHHPPLEYNYFYCVKMLFRGYPEIWYALKPRREGEGATQTLLLGG